MMEVVVDDIEQLVDALNYYNEKRRAYLQEVEKIADGSSYTAQCEEEQMNEAQRAFADALNKCIDSRVKAVLASAK